mgnify:CR=1 FL=1
MDRRRALKGLGLSLGYIVATPTIIGMLESCKTDENQWEPIFLTISEGIVIKNLIDLILPKTESIPGALEVNVPEFLDLNPTAENIVVVIWNKIRTAKEKGKDIYYI